MMTQWREAIQQLDAQLAELEAQTQSPTWRQLLRDLRMSLASKFGASDVPLIGKEISKYVNCASSEVQTKMLQVAQSVLGDLQFNGNDFVIKFIVQKYGDKVIVRLRCLKPAQGRQKSKIVVTDDDVEF